MEKGFIKKYVSQEKLNAHKEYVTAMQAGGQAPVPADAGQAPQGAPQGGAPAPEEMIEGYIAARQQNDMQAAGEIAMQFMDMVAQEYMAQAQAGGQGAAPAMREGGKAPSPKLLFDKDGKRVN